MVFVLCRWRFRVSCSVFLASSSSGCVVGVFVFRVRCSLRRPLQVVMCFVLRVSCVPLFHVLSCLVLFRVILCLVFGVSYVVLRILFHLQSSMVFFPSSFASRSPSSVLSGSCLGFLPSMGEIDVGTYIADIYYIYNIYIYIPGIYYIYVYIYYVYLVYIIYIYGYASCLRYRSHRELGGPS